MGWIGFSPGILWSVCCLLSIVVLPQWVMGFYLPGLTPVDYEAMANIDVVAYQLTSNTNKVPYDYWSLPFCPVSENRLRDPRSSSRSVAHSTGLLGAALIGERPRITGYEIRMKTNQTCRISCTREVSGDDMKVLIKRIQQRYRVKLALDELPVVQVLGRLEKGTGRKVLIIGYPLGFLSSKGDVFLYNHLKFTVYYHRPLLSASEEFVLSPSGSLFRVVGFEVVPQSFEHDSPDKESCQVPTSGREKLLRLPDTKSIKAGSSFRLTFSYEVEFIENEDMQWATRWDPLISSFSDRRQVHWFAMANAVVLGLFMTGVIGLILLRTLYKDFSKYYADLEDRDDDESLDHFGWKVLTGDVFRAPPAPTLLAVTASTGTQIVLLSLIALASAMLGLVSPGSRGGVLTGMLLSWVLTSGLAGYLATHLYRSFGGNNWKKVTTGTALLFPSLCFSIFSMMNILLWTMGSIGAAPIVTVLVLLVLWLGVSVPLAFVGGFLAQSRKVYHFPVRTNAIPRQIPIQPAFLGLPLYIVAGALPFGITCTELIYILNSMWLNEYYVVFGLLTFVAFLLAIISAETCVVVAYVKLLSEDYRWWWQSFGVSLVSSLYLVGYCVVYLFTAGDLVQGNLASLLIFFSYTVLLSWMYALGVGTIGFFATLWFLRKIYSAIRVD